MKKLRLFFTYCKQLGKIITMKMNRIIPVILVTVVLVTGSLVNAYSLNTSGKLRLDSKKNFLASRSESTPGNTSDNTIFESYKGTIASRDVIRMDAYNGSTITHYYFHTNAIGSTTAVTDANGQVVERYKYGLYGMPTFMDAAGNVMSKSAIGNNILFQGREYEPETNFYYFRARHLDPILERFLQTDPMGYRDSMNLYQAFNMNPVNFVDPFGEESYVDFIERSIAIMRSRGYSEARINRMMDELKRGHIAKVDYRNSYVDEMPGVKDSLYEGIEATLLSTKKKIFDFLRNLTDPDTIAENLENLPDNIKNKAVSISEKISDSINEGDIFAVQKAFGQEIYQASPIPEFTATANPNYSLEERADAFIGFLFKMGTYILAAKHYQPRTVNGGKVKVRTGANRTAEYGKNWKKVSLKETTERIAGKDPLVVINLEKGKIILKNKETGMQLIYDHSGNYFRVFNPNLPKNIQYVSEYGNPIPNNLPLVKAGKTVWSGLPKAVRKALTHFLNID